MISNNNNNDQEDQYHSIKLKSYESRYRLMAQSTEAIGSGEFDDLFKNTRFFFLTFFVPLFPLLWFFIFQLMIPDVIQKRKLSREREREKNSQNNFLSIKII
ncbi:hypothetical protein Glove_212g165 [Diversispora epigaea]|uniref:Uncharacterized protein n=1 Tax=Diversispora epigaea TaxID=1348612 RepID=A0A397IKW0_9GLOM|nr:hypothetical protein Glove_212g165 [Diversispora epigaea]